MTVPTVYTSDVEADALLDEINKLWCASFTELDDGRRAGHSFTLTKMDDIANMFANENNILVMHNGHSYDKRAIEKVLGVKVKAEIIDTLFISWYLYPKQQRHGLAWWGEELGIPKPEIDDWENLSLEEYIHRCQEDVKIQTLLWRHLWKHLALLYKTDEEIWHCVRHLSFKAKCVSLQEKSRWKLDVPKCQEIVVDFGERYSIARDALEVHMPDVPKYKKKTRPKKPFKMDGSLSAHGQAWSDLVVEEVGEPDHGLAVNYDKEIKVLYKHVPPNAGAHGQLKDWLTQLGWVPETFKYVREKDSQSQRKIPQIKDADTGELCPSVERLIAKEPAIEYLREMSVVKHRLGVCEGFLRNVDEEGYVQATVQGFTNTLRFKHKVCVNLPSDRKPYGLLIRKLLVARQPNLELCGSDMSSLEDRTKQHYMFPHDPEYVADMQVPGFDPHLDMAESANLLTPEQSAEFRMLKKMENKTKEQAERFAELGLIRHGGKTTNYAATYGARGPTIARAAGVPESIGERLYDAYWKRNWSLIAIADSCVVKQSRGLKWLWNPVARMWVWLKAEKDRFSTLNQSTGAYCFDRWLYHVLEAREQLTAQFHDEGIWELKKGNRDAMTKILKDAIAKVNKELNLNRDLDCDVAFDDSYGGIH